MTQKELAELIGVSYSTVSLALSDSSKVKKETREKIKEMAKSVGYRPNLAAKNLKGQSSKVIGIIFPDFTNFFYGELTAELHKNLKQKGYSGLFHTATGDDISFVIDEMISRQVDGVISFTYNLKDLMPLHQAQIPLVIYNNHGLPFSSVSVEREKGGYMVGEYLISQGKKDFAYVGAHPNFEDPRLTGFKTALAEKGFKLPEENIAYGSGIPANYQGMKKLLQNKSKIDAVFCFNDHYAIGVYRAIQEAGLKIPDDIAVIGFDNIQTSEFMYPALTTINQPTDKIASNIIDLLFEMIKKTIQGFQTINIEPELIIRESC